MNGVTLCIFAKPPIPGKVKTRLAAKLGDTQAAALATAFLSDTWQAAQLGPWTQVVLATTDGTEAEFGLTPTPQIWLQGDGDLGARIERIILRGLGETSAVIAIGADSPGLPPRLLHAARAALHAADAVLGPSDDGGFYLVGMRRCLPGLFAGLPWSEAGTFAATRQRFEQSGLEVAILEPWFDVDLPEDLDRLRQTLRSGAAHAPATATVLASIPTGAALCE